RIYGCSPKSIRSYRFWRNGRYANYALVSNDCCQYGGGKSGAAVMLVMACMYLVNDIYGTIMWVRLEKEQSANVANVGK
ncbi:MAG: hypothetical protein LBQ05_00570, partial [Christensenellaceae bacterium]|nr:hypothetical protein [Christensenellaceae bacterium]